MSSRRRRTRRESTWGALPQVVTVVLVLGLVGAMAIQPTRQLLAQRDRIGVMSGDLNALEKDNRRLQERVELLNDPDYLEQEARRVGLVRPGETTYVVVPPPRGQSRRQAKRAEPDVAPQPEDPGFLESFLHFVGLR